MVHDRSVRARYTGGVFGLTFSLFFVKAFSSLCSVSPHGKSWGKRGKRTHLQHLVQPTELGLQLHAVEHAALAHLENVPQFLQVPLDRLLLPPRPRTAAARTVATALISDYDDGTHACHVSRTGMLVWDKTLFLRSNKSKISSRATRRAKKKAALPCYKSERQTAVSEARIAGTSSRHGRRTGIHRHVTL